MSELSQYAGKYETMKMERRDGILLVTLHTKGGSLQWGLLPHKEMPLAFHDIANDHDNKVVILTGTGAEFSGPRVTSTGHPLFPTRPSMQLVDRIIQEGKQGLMSFLNIDVPIISAVNGPAWRHSEVPLLADIVLAADTAQFQDSAHFTGGLVPGDGMHVVYPLLLGINRARYFLLTGQTLSAHEARELGLVAEVLPPDKLMARAFELAEDIARRPASLVRQTRAVLTEYLKRHMQELLGFGLYTEMLALMDRPEAPPTA